LSDEEKIMSKKIGHNPVRDPYLWDKAEESAKASSWTCCGMKLPATYLLCPVCENRLLFDAVDDTEPEI
jgi:hypothetical protein